MKCVFGLCLGFYFLAAPAWGNSIRTERVVSPGGIEAWLIRDHRNPIISFRFAFRGGTALDPPGKGGLAAMVSSLLDEGAGDFDSMAFQKTLEDKAIHLGFESEKDSFSGHLQTLTRNREEAFRMLKLALTVPRFDPEPVERIRAQILIALKRKKEDPHTLAANALFRSLFPNHPYGQPTDGSKNTVEKISIKDMKDFIRKRFGRDNLVVAAVGDITPDVLNRLLDETFLGLPARAASWELAKVDPVFSGKTQLIKKDIPQSTIMFADYGLTRGSPDFYAALVMQHILGGGGFTSRLYSEVREKRGLAYSVYSSLYPFVASGLTIGSAGTANERVAKTLEVIQTEWKRMATKGINESEVTDAKRHLTGSFPLRFSSSGRIARMLVGMQLFNLGIDYFEKRNSYIDSVTSKDVKRVVKKLLNTRGLTIVVVGRPVGIPIHN